MNMLRVASLILLGLAPGELHSQEGAISGTVYVDANANGKRDAGERGLASATVSNQDVVVTTDASGSYRIARGSTGVVFVSVPDGHRAVGSFWRPVSDTTRAADFALAPVARTASFTFIHASDTHVAPAVLARTQRFRAMSDSINPAFVIITGDLVRDALRVGETEAVGYYDLFAREAALFKSTVHTVPGNHELFGIERALSKVSTSHPLYQRAMYRQYRGPDYYSFNHGGVHFVGLNSVDNDDQWYYGHVDSLQLAWLERDLAAIPANMPVVTFNHIPFVSTFDGLNGYREDSPAPTLITVKGKTMFRHTISNAGDVLRALRQRQHVLALGGHVHAGERIEYFTDGLRTRFNQTPAIVGAPASAGMQFASGFTLYRVRNGVIDAGEFIPLGVDGRK
jgi:3',5'-cyclic AMP phosphodiesterase CpdA